MFLLVVYFIEVIYLCSFSLAKDPARHDSENPTRKILGRLLYGEVTIRCHISISFPGNDSHQPRFNQETMLHLFVSTSVQESRVHATLTPFTALLSGSDHDYLDLSPRPEGTSASFSSPQRLAQRRIPLSRRPDVRDSLLSGSSTRIDSPSFTVCRFADQSKISNGTIRTKAIALALPEDASDVSK